MKVIVLWEDPSEQSLATNLVKVLRTIGYMLIHGKVKDGGVEIADWQDKPRVKMNCVAGPANSSARIDFGSPLRSVTEYRNADGSVSFEMPYVDGIGYGPPQFTKGEPVQPNAFVELTREVMRDMYTTTPFPREREKPKPVVPKPDTTKTGVTIRAIDLGDDDHDADTTD